MQSQQQSGQPHIFQNQVVVFSKNYLPLARINLKRSIRFLVTGQAESLGFGSTQLWEVRCEAVPLGVNAQCRTTNS
jgi:hypothetical protein